MVRRNGGGKDGILEGIILSKALLEVDENNKQGFTVGHRTQVPVH